MEKIALLTGDSNVRLQLQQLVCTESVPTMLTLESYTLDDFLTQRELTPFIGLILDTREALRTSSLEALEKLALKYELPIVLLSDRRNASVINQRFFTQPYEILDENILGIIFPKVLHHLKERSNLIRELKAAREEARLELQSRIKLLENVAHEFRVLINSLLLGMESMRVDENEEKVLARSETRRTAAQLMELLEELAPMLRVPLETTAATSKAFSLRDRINKVTVAYLMRARAQRIRFVRAVDAEVPDILQGNYFKLEWILLHLLNHAFESTTEDGYVSLYVHLEKFEGNAVDLHFAISETGDGSKLYDERALALRRDLRREVVCRLAEELGGRSWVDSEEELGSTCHLICRFEKIIEATNHSRVRILVVDDNPTNRLVATKMLEKMGYEVLVAKDGLEAFELFRITNVDLILMDIQMPVMDGFEATQKIRELEKESERNNNGKIGIIAVTAHVSEEHKALCLAAGMDGYLPKPIDFLSLRKLISEFIPCEREETGGQAS